MNRISGQRTRTRCRILLLFLMTASSLPLRAQDGEVERLYRAGAEALEKGRAEDAIGLLGGVAARDPAYRDVQLLLGQSLLLAGLAGAAEQHLEAAHQQAPDDPQRAFLYGLALHQDNRWVEAEEVFTRALLSQPQNPFPLLYRGLARLELGRGGEARVDIETAAASAPDDPAVRLAVARLELAEGNYAAAEAPLWDLLSAGDDLEVRLLLGRTLFEGGRPLEAVDVLRPAVAAAPRRSDALYLLSQALLRSGQSREGRAALQRFQEMIAVEERMRVLESRLRTEPENVELRFELVRLLLDHGASARARLHLAELQRQAPNDPRLADLRAALR